MYITFILPDLKGGGAQKMLINLANWFADNGHRVDLVVFNTSGIYKDLIATSVNVIDFECKRSIFAIGKLSSHIKTNAPDIAFSALYHVNVISILAHKISQTPSTQLIISERNNILENLKGKSIFAQKLWAYLIRETYPLAHKIVSISHGVQNALQSYLKTQNTSQYITIYNPVITEEMKSKIGNTAPSIFPDDAQTKLITAGRLVAQKDYPTLLKSFQRYLDHDPSAHLVILGWGELENDLKSLSHKLGVADNITFSGFVENPLPLMAQADIFVITSAWEGFCNVIVEALYCGLNIVATDCVSGPSEILEDGKYGFLSPVGDDEHIANNIIAASETPIDKSTLKKRAQDFHVCAIGSQFLNLFETVSKS